MRHATPMIFLIALLCGCNDSSFSGSSGKKADPPPASKTATSPAPAGRNPVKTAPTAQHQQSGDALGKAQNGQPNANTVIPQTDPGQPAAATPAPPAVAPTDDPLASVDSACANGGGGPGGILGALFSTAPLAPQQQPLPRTAPDDCRAGFEINNYHGTFQLAARQPSRAITLEVDVATYQAPDEIKMYAVTDAGDQLFFDTCRLKTSNYMDPTDGSSRPPEDSVRYYRPNLPAGTKALRVDFSGSATPQYLKVVGLCDFDGNPSNVQGDQPPIRPAQ